MRLALLLAVAGLALLVIAAISFDWQEGARAETTTVIEVGDNWFCDPGDTACMNDDLDDVDVVTTINVGDAVEWLWVGSVDHTTTECAGDLDACSEPHLWDSPEQTSGTFSFTFDSPGTFVYRCQIHPSAMRGQIIVLAAEQPTPTLSPSPAPSPTSPPTAPLAPSPTPSSAVLAPVAVPAGGGPPADVRGTPALWGLFLVAGGTLLMSAAIALAVRAVRPA